MAVALGYTLTQFDGFFDHFCISGSDGNDYKFGFGTYVTSNQKGPPLS